MGELQICSGSVRREDWITGTVVNVMWMKRGVFTANSQEMLLKPANSKNIMKQTQAGSLKTNGDNDSSKEDDIKDESVFVNLKKVFCTHNSYENKLEGHVYKKYSRCYHFELSVPDRTGCIEWLNYDPYNPKPRNLYAFGTMKPIIDVWDFNMMDNKKPYFKLGRNESRKKGLERIGHKSRISDMAWNQHYRHILASGSADKTVLLWDLENCKPMTKFDSFENTVVSLKWNPQEIHKLLTGCRDKTVRLFDCKEETVVKSWNVRSAVKKVIWNHHNTNYCIVCLKESNMLYFDVRANKAVWEIQPHGDFEIVGFIVSASYPGLFITASEEGLIKIWDIIEHEAIPVWEEKYPSIMPCVAANPYNELILKVCRMNPRVRLNHSCCIDTIDFSVIPEVRNRFANRIVSHSSTMNVTEEIEGMEIDE